MKLSEFKKDKFLAYSFLSSIAVIVIAGLFGFLSLLKTNNLLIMHFDGYKGIDFLGDKNDLYSIIGTSALIVFLNLWLSLKFYFKERFLSYMMSFFSVVFSLLILITVFVIISIN